MLTEPAVKRALVFIDGQNLFHGAKEAFGVAWPNYDIEKLAHAICAKQGWVCHGIHFYTGVPEPHDHPFWSQFWKESGVCPSLRRA